MGMSQTIAMGAYWKKLAATIAPKNNERVLIGGAIDDNIHKLQMLGDSLFDGALVMKGGSANTGSGTLFGSQYNIMGNKQFWIGDLDFYGNGSKSFVRILSENNITSMDAVNGSNTLTQDLTLMGFGNSVLVGTFANDSSGSLIQTNGQGNSVSWNAAFNFINGITPATDGNYAFPTSITIQNGIITAIS